MGWRSVLKAAAAPPGYTRHTVVTEWLTLNCAGLWTFQGRTASIEILFSREEDARRARRAFHGTVVRTNA